MLIHNEIVIKVEKKVYLIFSLLFSPIIIGTFYINIYKYGDNVEGAIIMLFIFAFIFRFSLYKIILTSNGILYRSFIGYKEISWGDIFKYRTDFNIGYNKPSMALNIFTKESKKAKLIINIKPFSKKDLKILFNILDEVVENNK